MGTEVDINCHGSAHLSLMADESMLLDGLTQGSHQPSSSVQSNCSRTFPGHINHRVASV